MFPPFIYSDGVFAKIPQKSNDMIENRIKKIYPNFDVLKII